MNILSSIFTKKVKESIAIFLCISSLVFSFFFAVSNPYYSDGDELHYLLMTQSLILDGDLDLMNNYENKDYFEHKPGKETTPHGTDIYGQWRSHHQFFVSVIGVPGYMARGVLGARLSLWILSLVGVWVMWLLLRDLGFSKTFTALVVAIFNIQLPIMVYSQYMFTDLFSGYFVLVALYLLQKYHRTKNIYWALFSSAVAGLGVWNHVKLVTFFLPLYFGYALYLYLSEKYYPKKFSVQGYVKSVGVFFKKYYVLAIACLSPFFIGVAGLAYLFYRWTGEFSITIIHDLALERIQRLKPGHWSFDTGGSFYMYDLGHSINSFLGLIFDGSNGVLYNAPIYIFIFLGFVVLLRKNKTLAWISFVMFALILGRQTMFIKWLTWGPVARYMIVFLPTLMLVVAYGLRQLVERTSGKILLTVVTIYSVLLSWSAIGLGRGYPAWKGINRSMREVFSMLSISFDSEYLSINIDPIPLHSTTDYYKIAVLTLLIAIMTWYYARPMKEKKSK